jgi:hypothetical protein
MRKKLGDFGSGQARGQLQRETLVEVELHDLDIASVTRA